MKTLTVKISSESLSQNYDNEGKGNGQSNNLNYRIMVKEDNTEVGNVSINVSSSYYSNPEGMDYNTAKTAFEEKLKKAVEAVKSALQS